MRALYVPRWIPSPARLRRTLRAYVAAAILVATTATVAETPADTSASDMAASPASERETVYSRLELDRLVKSADWVVHADVGEKSARWVAGNIETSFQITVRESLIGSGPDNFELTLLGGEAPNGAPVSQLVRGMPQLFPGEEVVLFLRTDNTARLAKTNAARHQAGLQPIANNPESRMSTTPRIVGNQKGKFSVLTLENGQKFLMRYRTVGILPTAETMATMRGLDAQRIEESLDLYERKHGIRPIVPSSETADPAAASSAAPGSAARPANYAPSRVTDPKAEQFRAPNARLVSKLLPHNADGVIAPVPLEPFRREVRRLEQRKATPTP